MKSEKYNLIWQDVKSWLVTTAIFVLPIALQELIAYLGHYDLGNWGVVIALALGSLLKLAQKWNEYNAYPKE